MDANINAINEVLTKTGDSVNWHLLTLWGSEFRYLNGGFYNFKNVGNAIAINPAKKLLQKIKRDKELKEKVMIVVERKDVIYKLKADVSII